MFGSNALTPDGVLPEDFSSCRGCGQAEGGSLLVGRRVVSQSKSDKLDLKIKVLVVDNNATLRRMIRNYLRKNGSKKSTRSEENILPQAIFWLKK